VLFYVLFILCRSLYCLFVCVCVCVCVLNYCHRVATQLQLNISYQVPSKRAPPSSSSWPLWRELPVSKALLYEPLKVPSKAALSPGSRRRAATERNAPFPQRAEIQSSEKCLRSIQSTANREEKKTAVRKNTGQSKCQADRQDQIPVLLVLLEQPVPAALSLQVLRCSVHI